MIHLNDDIFLDKFLHLDLIDEYHNLLKEYQEINDRYEKLILDDSLISLQEECDAVKKQLEKRMHVAGK